ncbi:MAG: hypothetical protein KGH60_00655 [Candidatus Micrarchaeota archaeon]|nr:hypothetical protein [Candidatus Micrarchaeota archaeon]
MAPADTPQRGAGGEARTSIDALVDLLKARGRSELNEVSQNLGVDPLIVESWAKVLEGGGIVKISYEVGKMYLEPVTLTAEQTANVKAKLESAKVVLQHDIAAHKAVLEKFAADLEAMGSSVSELEKIYQQKLPEVQQMLSELNKVYDTVELQNRSVTDIKKSAEDTYNGINKRITDLVGKIDAFNATNEAKGLEERLSSVNDVIKRVSDTEKALEELEKNKNKAFETIKRSVDEQVKQIRAQISSASNEVAVQLKLNKSQLDDLIKQLKQQYTLSKDISNQINEFKREGEASKKTLANAKTAFDDKYDRLKHDIDGGASLIDASAKGLVEKVNAVKSQFGDAAKIDDDLKGMRKSVDQVGKEISDARLELAELTEQAKVLESITNATPERKASVVSDVEEKDAKLKGRLAGLKKSIEDTKGKVDKRQGKGSKDNKTSGK